MGTPIRLHGSNRFTVSLLKEWQARGLGTRDMHEILGISREAVQRLLRKPDYFPVDSERFNWFTALQGGELLEDYIEALKSGAVPARPR